LLDLPRLIRSASLLLAVLLPLLPPGLELLLALLPLPLLPAPLLLLWVLPVTTCSTSSPGGPVVLLCLGTSSAQIRLPPVPPLLLVLLLPVLVLLLPAV
jgi:hypothetical protein